MAKHMIITDDLDGSPHATPVTFALEGTTYSIDLGEQSMVRLRAALAPFIERAQTSQRAALAAIKDRNAGADRGYDLSELRSWAATNEIHLPQRGRIPRAVIDQYRSATGG